jgi:metal-responsive CopG/Arc/MetJ family transcriptional regulator
MNLLLPEDVIESLDRVAGPRGRSRYVADAVRERVRRDERIAAIRAAAGIWKDHPDFPSSEAVVEWVRRLRSEDRDPWADPER